MRVKRSHKQTVEELTKEHPVLYVTAFEPCSGGVFSSRVKRNLKPVLLKNVGSLSKLGNSKKEYDDYDIFRITEVFHTTLEESEDYYNSLILDYANLHQKALDDFKSKYLINKETL